MSKSSKDLAITISKYNRGSLTTDEMNTIVEFFKHRFFYIRLLIVNEHKNFKGEQFEHIHISCSIGDPIRRDNFKCEIVKKHSFLQHNKDVMIKEEYDDGWKQYCSKCSDRNILYTFGITDEEMEKYKSEYDINKQMHKDIKEHIVKTRISPMDLPYTIINYIHNHDIHYTGDLDLFTNIIFRMIKENYDFQIVGKMKETKCKVDIILVNKPTDLYDIIHKEFSNY